MTVDFRLGLRLPPAPAGRPGEWLSEMSRAAEEAGFGALFVADEPEQVLHGAGLEAYGTLGAMALFTRRVLLGALSSPAGLRPPALLAKLVTTLDVVSEGRAVLGLGTDRSGALTGDSGWAPWADERVVLTEATEICRAMFRDEVVEHAGALVTLTSTPNRPRPRRPGGPPVMLAAGDLDTAATARLADWVIVARGVNRPQVLDDLAGAMELAGRPRSALTAVAVVPGASCGPDVDERVEEELGAGLDAVVVDLSERTGPDSVAALGRRLSAAFDGGATSRGRARDD